MRLIQIALLLFSFTSNGAGNIDSLEALLPKSGGDERREIYLELAEEYMKVDILKAADYANTLISISKGRHEWESRGYYIIGTQYGIRGITDSCLIFMELAMDGFTAIDDVSGMANVNMVRGNIALQIGNYQDATEYYLEALKIHEQTGNEFGVGRIQLSLGNVNLRLEKYNDAFVHYNFAWTAFKILSDSLRIANVLNNIGQTHDGLMQFDSALQYYSASVEIRRRNGQPDQLAGTYLNMGNSFMELGAAEMARRYDLMALAIFKDIRSPRGLAMSYLNLGKSYRTTQIDSSEFFLLKAQAIADSIDLVDARLEIYRSLAAVYKNKQEWRNSLKYQELYLALYQRTYEAEMVGKIAGIHADYNREKEHRLRMSATEQFKRNRFLMFLFIALSGISILLLLVVLRYFSLRKRSLEQRQMLAEQENCDLKDLLQHKDRELVSNALKIIRRNELINEIIFEVDMIASSNKVDHLQELKNIVNRLTIGMNDKAWEEFDARFENVFTGFYESLLEVCPDLSPTELKLCALLRLNMSSKDIASLTNRSIRTIETTRLNIRKKLKLLADDNLVTFLIRA